MDPGRRFFSRLSPLDKPEPVPETVETVEERPEIPQEQPLQESTPKEPAKPLLQVENLSMDFGDQTVLRKINFTVHRGESVAIIGESGCGKTVLLKTLNRLLVPIIGRVLFDGYDLATLSYVDLAQIQTRYGFVFQQAALFDSMSIGENIAFPLQQHTTKSFEEISEIVVRLLREVGLSSDTVDKKPGELSGGMRKRVGFARALAMEPELMLYDEPTTGLDPIMSDVINELMIDTHRHHDVTSIMVTHDMKSACKVAERIIMLFPAKKLRDGESHIIFDGTPDEMQHATDPRVAQFLK